MTNLPALVYGTLRPGCSNYRVFLEARTTSEKTVKVDGYRMYSAGPYPYIIPAAGGQITATLVHVDDRDYAQVLKGLDFLEGYVGPGEPNHYDRVTAFVETEEGMVEAYIYVAGADLIDGIAMQFPVVESGDWIQHLDETNYKPGTYLRRASWESNMNSSRVIEDSIESETV